MLPWLSGSCGSPCGSPGIERSRRCRRAGRGPAIPGTAGCATRSRERSLLYARARGRRRAAVPPDDGVEVDTPSVVSVGRRRSGAPERLRDVLDDPRSVPVALLECRPQVVALEIGEDVLHHERSLVRHDERVGLAVVDHREEERVDGEEIVVDPLVDGRSSVSMSATRRSRSMTRSCTWQLRAADLAHSPQADRLVPTHFVAPRLEVVQQVDLEKVDQRRVDLAGDAVAVQVVGGVADRRPREGVLGRIEGEAGWARDRRTGLSGSVTAQSTGSQAWRPISSLKAPMMNSRIEIVWP